MCFFFKQKTAYEMRISDWSSDVCSSDLLNSHILKFNGYLFKDQTVIALDAEEIGLLIEAAEHKWNHVEPAIFGTLLERALDGKERAKLGAHSDRKSVV